jgi:hypothetical protein
MVNWASDVATAAVTGQGREPVSVSRVVLEARGGAVVVQWSLSYQAQLSNRPGVGDQYPLVQLQAMAALERDGLELARWTLGEDQAQGTKDRWVAVRAAGTAGGLFVDRTPGSGRKTYQLKVWNERMTRYGTATITVGTRTMICEER